MLRADKRAPAVTVLHILTTGIMPIVCNSDNFMLYDEITENLVQCRVHQEKNNM